MRTTFFTLYLTCVCNFLSAQHTILDSLVSELKDHTQNDTSKVRLLTAISWNAWGTEPQKTKDYAGQALVLAEQLKDIRGIGDAYKGICRYYWSQTEYNKSMDYA